MKNIRHYRTARKEYLCEQCKITIRKGDKYYRLFGSSDDNWREPRPYEMILCDYCGSKSQGLKDCK